VEGEDTTGTPATRPDERVLALLEAAVVGARDKGAQEVVTLDVAPVLSVTSYFVICSAPSDRQVKAIAESVEAAVAACDGTRPVGTEGLDTLEWVLINFGEFLVHVFRTETRDFYGLERLWRDVPRLAL
jgi:ribosome-associated protein